VGVGSSNIVGTILQFFKLKCICVYCATIINIIEHFNKWLSLHIMISHIGDPDEIWRLAYCRVGQNFVVEFQPAQETAELTGGFGRLAVL
jgi:hypothetical protein